MSEKRVHRTRVTFRYADGFVTDGLQRAYFTNHRTFERSTTIPLCVGFREEEKFLPTNWIDEEPIGPWNNVIHRHASGYINVAPSDWLEPEWGTSRWYDPERPWTTAVYNTWPGSATFYGHYYRSMLDPVSVSGGSAPYHAQFENRRIRYVYDGTYEWKPTTAVRIEDGYLYVSGYYTISGTETQYILRSTGWVLSSTENFSASGLEHSDLKRDLIEPVYYGSARLQDCPAYSEYTFDPKWYAPDIIKELDLTYVDYGDLSLKAAENVRPLNINFPLYFRDMGQLGQLAKSLTSPPRSSGTRALLKSASCFYLAVHYGLRLTILDTQTISESLQSPTHNGWSRAGAQEDGVITGFANADVHWTRRCSMFIFRVPEEDLTALQRLRKAREQVLALDIAPTVANIWDAIPFSFCFDWFIPLGDLLDKREGRQYLQTLPIHHSFYSTKLTWTDDDYSLERDGWKATGSINYGYYTRDCCVGCIPPSTLRVDSPQGSLPKHWLEATALIISIW